MCAETWANLSTSGKLRLKEVHYCQEAREEKRLITLTRYREPRERIYPYDGVP